MCFSIAVCYVGRAYFFMSFFKIFLLISGSFNDMDKIYHGFFYKNTAGTNKIIIAGEHCVVPTDKYFWKDPNDIKHGLKTRSRANNKPTFSFQAVDKYLEHKIETTIDFYVNK